MYDEPILKKQSTGNIVSPIKKKATGAVVSKKRHADSFLGLEKTLHYWFYWMIGPNREKSKFQNE